MMALITNRQLPFILISTGLFLGLILPLLIQDGMFMDGQIYACLAKNWAEGRSDFWHPVFSQTYLKNGHAWFLEQPPLAFAMEGMLFKLIGDSIYTERLYAFLMAVLTAFFITRIWRCIFSYNDEWKALFWLPLLCWILIPVVFWSYQNNMLENTMGMFVALALWMTIRGMQSAKWQGIACLGVAALCVCASGLVKGFQGLFPVMTPCIWWLVMRKHSFRKMLWQTGIIVAVPGMIYAALWWDANSRSGLEIYLFDRVFNSIRNVSTGTGRFYLPFRLFTELIPPLILTVAVWICWVMKNRRKHFFRHTLKLFLFFVLLGAAGSFPLIITLEQRGFYLTTAMPCWAVALAVLMTPPISAWIRQMKPNGLWHRFWLISGIALCVFSLALTLVMKGKTKRDAGMLHDVYLLCEHLDEGSLISIPASMWNEWSLQAYLIRHKYISLDGRNENRPYFLKDKQLSYQLPGMYIKENDLKLLKYELFRRKQQEK